MTRPTDAHTEAVALVVRPAMMSLWTYGSRAEEMLAGQAWDIPIARALLTSTDSNVLDALQDALVRAGRLTEETDTDWCSEVNSWWRCPASTYYSPYTCGCSCNLAGPHVAHECVDGHTTPFDIGDRQPQRTCRLVTAWEVQE